MMLLKFKRLFLLSTIVYCAIISLMVAASNVPVQPVQRHVADEVSLRRNLDQIFESILEWDHQGKPFDHSITGKLLEKAFKHWSRIKNKFINAGWYQNLMPQACGAISEKFDALFKLLLQEENGQHYATQLVELRSMIEQLMLNIQDRVSGFSGLGTSIGTVQEPMFQKPFSQEVLERSKITQEKLAQSDFFKNLVMERAQNILRLKLSAQFFCEENKLPQYKADLVRSILKSKLELFAGRFQSFYSMETLKLRDFYGYKNFKVLLNSIFEENKKWLKSWTREVLDIFVRDRFFLVPESDVLVMQPTDQEAWGYDIEKAAESIDTLEKQFKVCAQVPLFNTPKGYIHIGNEAPKLINACRENLGKLKSTWAGSVGEFFGWSKKLSAQEELEARKKLVVNLNKLLEFSKQMPLGEDCMGAIAIQKNINHVVEDFIASLPRPDDICKLCANTCGSAAVDAVKKERLAQYKERINQIEYIIEIQNKMLESMPEDQTAEYALMRIAVSEASNYLEEYKKLVAQYNSFICSTGKIDDVQTMFDGCEKGLDRLFTLFKQASCEFGKPIFTANLCAPRKSCKDVEPEIILNQQKFGVPEKKSAFSRWILDPLIIHPFINKIKSVATESLDGIVQQKCGLGGWKDGVKNCIAKLVKIPDTTLSNIGRGLQWRESLAVSFAASLLNYKASRWVVRAVLPDTISYLEYLDNAGLDAQQVITLLNQCAILMLGKISINDLISQMIERPACFKLYLKHIMLKLQNVVDDLKPNSLSSLSQKKKDEIYQQATLTYFPQETLRIVMDKKGAVDKWWLMKSLSDGMGTKAVSKNTFEKWNSFAENSKYLSSFTSLQSLRNNYFAHHFKAHLTSHLTGLIKMLPVQADQDAWAKLITNADVSALNSARNSISSQLKNLKNQKKKLDESYSWFHYLWVPSLISYWKQDSLLQLTKQSLSTQKRLCVHAIALSNVNKKFLV